MDASCMLPSTQFLKYEHIRFRTRLTTELHELSLRASSNIHHHNCHSKGRHYTGLLSDPDLLPRSR